MAREGAAQQQAPIVMAFDETYIPRPLVLSAAGFARAVSGGRIPPDSRPLSIEPDQCQVETHAANLTPRPANVTLGHRPRTTHPGPARGRPELLVSFGRRVLRLHEQEPAVIDPDEEQQRHDYRLGLEWLQMLPSTTNASWWRSGRWVEERRAALKSGERPVDREARMSFSSVAAR